MALQFASFRYIKTIWFGLKNGHDESAPTPCGVFAAIYCVINNPFGMHAAVYFTQRISHFVAEQNNLFASVLMLNHCLLLLFLSPMEQLFKVGKVFFHNHTYALCVERVTCKVAIVGSVVEV